MKSVALFSPYIPKHSGGGERYLLSIAQVLSRHAHVSLLVPQMLVSSTQSALPQYERTFGLDLSNVHVRATAIGSLRLSLAALQESSQYDILFAMTDGSIFPSFARQSYLIMQVPWTRQLTALEHIKLMSWKNVLVYSDFVRRVLRESWSTSKIRVISPYVDLDEFTPGKKERLIINTGRFFAHSQSNSKKQDVLVQAFTTLVDKHSLKGWHLALLGNIDPNPDSYRFVEHLKELGRGYQVSIHSNLSFDALRAYYSRASIYWHAAGYQVDEHLHPENTEHFGITTLEAMASKAVPFVVPKGGQLEILGIDSLYWNSIDELVEKTYSFIREAPAKKEMLENEVHAKAKKYSTDVFEREILSLL